MGHLFKCTCADYKNYIIFPKNPNSEKFPITPQWHDDSLTGRLPLNNTTKVLDGTDTMSKFSNVNWREREPYASVITYIRTKLRFALLRSTLAAVQRFRGKRSDVHLQDLTDIDFSLIPRPTVT